MKALIFEGNTKQRNKFITANDNSPYHKLFIKTIKQVNNNIQCDVAFPTNDDYKIFSTSDLKKYDYVFWTGSSLNAYDDTPEVLQQIEQAKIVFESGVPFYGSCWGLQVAVMASGGMVSPCKNGIEIGIAKNIVKTIKAKNHPFLNGRNSKYNSLCVHSSETSKIPEGATLLAYNNHSNVQALEIKHKKGIFWGVQYHPEFDSNELLGSIKRNPEKYIEMGILNYNTTPQELIDSMVNGYENDLEENNRLIEFKNFINYFKMK